MSSEYPTLPPHLQSIYETLKREAATTKNEGTEVDNEGNIFHCLSHIVMKVEAYAFEVGEGDRSKTEELIRSLLRDAGAYPFPEEAAEEANGKLRAFEEVVFPVAPDESDSEYPGRVMGMFHMPERPDADYVVRVRERYEDILPFFRDMAGT